MKKYLECEISIFMPVYNGGKYLKESIESLLSQTFRDFELVCVDDSSTDDSFEILENYAINDSRIRVYQKSNGGIVPVSWNFVIPLLKGNSITYMSQDDLMSEDNLECMFNRQIETDADCVLPDMVWYYEGKSENKVIVGVNGDRDRIISNKEAVTLSLQWEIHGFGLWKACIFKDRTFREDAFDSDELFIRESYLLCNKIAFCKGVFYYRRDNGQAITQTFDVKNYYSVLTRFRIYKLLENNQFDEDILNFGFITVVFFIFLNYRYSWLRRKELSKEEFKKIRLMFYDTYRGLDIKRIQQCAFQEKGLKRLKYLMVYLVFFNYRVFQAIMLLVYMFDRIRLSIGIYNVDSNSGLKW